MKYETIILELLSRIKKLEEDVAELKQNRTNNAFDREQIASASVPYTKVTDDMIALCYEYGKKASEGENVQELAVAAAEKTGMNRSSAVIYICAVNDMLSGEIYKRAINNKALEKYFAKIFKEYGSIGLNKAITSVRQHITYRRSCGHNVDSVEEICNRAEAKL